MSRLFAYSVHISHLLLYLPPVPVFIPTTLLPFSPLSLLSFCLLSPPYTCLFSPLSPSAISSPYDRAENEEKIRQGRS